jgi:hypothetical protein
METGTSFGGEPQPAFLIDIHRSLLDQCRSAEDPYTVFNGTERQGQLPSGQTAKARPDYRVQSLHKGHGRRAFHRIQFP